MERFSNRFYKNGLKLSSIIFAEADKISSPHKNSIRKKK